MSDVNQEAGVKHIIITIPITAAEGGGGGHIEMSLEDFCKLDISQNTMAHLQEQSHDSGTQLSDNQQSPSDNSPNIISLHRRWLVGMVPGVHVMVLVVLIIIMVVVRGAVMWTRQRRCLSQRQVEYAQILHLTIHSIHCLTEMHSGTAP